MNIEHLHSVSKALTDDLEATQSLALLVQLRDSLQNQISSPQTPVYQQQTSSFLEQLLVNAKKSVTAGFSPVWRQTLQQIGGEDLFGNHLIDLILPVFARNQITPTIAYQEVSAVVDRLSALAVGLKSVISGFSILDLGVDELKPNRAEIGILIPRSMVDNHLKALLNEMRDLDRIVKTFDELTSGSRGESVVRQLASSDFSFFLEVAPVLGASVAVGVERIVALYKSLLEIRKLRRELESNGVPPGALSGIEDHANSLMAGGIKGIVEDFLRQYGSNLENGRLNELRNELTLHLNLLANKIDRGVDIQVRALSAAPPEVVTEELEQNNDNLAMAEIWRIASQTEFLIREGKPILTLPEPVELPPVEKKPVRHRSKDKEED